MKEAVYYWPKLDMLLVTDEFTCNKGATMLNRICYDLQGSKGKKPQILEGGFAVIMQHGTSRYVHFSSNSANSLIFIGLL